MHSATLAYLIGKEKLVLEKIGVQAIVIVISLHLASSHIFVATRRNIVFIFRGKEQLS